MVLRKIIIMRKTLILLCIIFSAIESFSQGGSIRILTYNIWNGYDWGKDVERRKRTTQWIANQKPSIVALQELCNYNDKKLKEDAEVWGHEYCVLLKSSGYSVGLTSDQPIRVVEKILKGMHHGALHCRTNDIDVFVVHFSPFSYKKRREEAAIILDRLDEVRKNNGKYMVLGDFNAHSPIDADLYDPEGPLLKRLRASHKDKPLNGNLLNGDLEYGVISSFLAFPLLDVCQPFTKGIKERGSFPGQVLGEVNNETREGLLERLERIDFILVSPEMVEKCDNAKVCNKEENYYLSDHYPVVAVFNF